MFNYRQYIYPLTFWLCMAVLLPVVSGCVKTTENRGYVVKLSRLEDIEEGKSTQTEVLQALGSPSTKSVFGDEVWYYIATKADRTAFTRPEIVEQEVFSIRFDTVGTVTEISRSTIEDSRNIEFSEDATPTEGNELGVIEQLLGNLGRFNPEE